MVSALQDENEPGGFLHSGTFLLVDQNRNIRGIYEGTDESEINRLIKDIEILNLNNGKPIINLHGKAKIRMGNIESSSISISNDGGFVVSVATFFMKN